MLSSCPDCLGTHQPFRVSTDETPELNFQITMALTKLSGDKKTQPGRRSSISSPFGDFVNVGTKLSLNLKSQKFQEPLALISELKPPFYCGEANIAKFQIASTVFFKLFSVTRILSFSGHSTVSFRLPTAFAASAPLFQTGR